MFVCFSAIAIQMPCTLYIVSTSRLSSLVVFLVIRCLPSCLPTLLPACCPRLGSKHVQAPQSTDVVSFLHILYFFEFSCLKRPAIDLSLYKSEQANITATPASLPNTERRMAVQRVTKYREDR